MADGPISRRKSCSECVKAKRKCGMEIPRCGRCSKKNIDCSYPNSRTSISDMHLPQLDFPWLDDLMREPGMLPWSGGLQPQLATTAVPLSATIGTPPVPRAIPEYLVADCSTRTSLATVEKDAAVHRFKTWPDKWLKEGKAPFIHPRLYTTSMPIALQDAYAACALYSTKTPDNEFVAFNIIETKAHELLRSPNQPSWTPLDLLAAVQALLIFQFLRLFDGDIRQRALAESAEPILEAWTEQLRARTQEEQRFTTDTAPSWRSWIFAESVRRSITMSIFLSGIYSLVKQGFCTLSEQVTANSFTAQRALWDASSAFEWERAKSMWSPHWINKMNFEYLLKEASGSEVDDFGMVLLITYKGHDVVDQWLASTNIDRNLIAAPNFHQSLLDMVQFADGSIASSEPT